MQSIKTHKALMFATAFFAVSVIASSSSSLGIAEAKQGQSDMHWPFRPYAYAKVYTFNFFPARHGVQLRIIKDGRWSEHIRSEQRVDQRVGEQVTKIVGSTKGTFEVSKCPFPRHAFVFFDEQDKPVASIDICFECGDLFAWPDFKVDRDEKYGVWDDDNEMLVGGLQHKYDAAMDAYRNLIVQLGLPIEPPQ